MHAIEGDLDGGYEILLDRPVGMFRFSQNYGLKPAGITPIYALENGSRDCDL